MLLMKQLAVFRVGSYEKHMDSTSLGIPVALRAVNISAQ